MRPAPAGHLPLEPGRHRPRLAGPPRLKNQLRPRDKALDELAPALRGGTCRRHATGVNSKDAVGFLGHALADDEHSGRGRHARFKRHLEGGIGGPSASARSGVPVRWTAPAG